MSILVQHFKLIALALIVYHYFTQASCSVSKNELLLNYCCIKFKFKYKEANLLSQRKNDLFETCIICLGNSTEDGTESHYGTNVMF